MFQGVVRGCGWQKIGACVNLGAYYLIGVPAAFCFAFVYHLGGKVVIYFLNSQHKFYSTFITRIS
jgi:Na+-driven multidrug efflux pump